MRKFVAYIGELQITLAGERIDRYCELIGATTFDQRRFALARQSLAQRFALVRHRFVLRLQQLQPLLGLSMMRELVSKIWSTAILFTSIRCWSPLFDSKSSRSCNAMIVLSAYEKKSNYQKTKIQFASILLLVVRRREFEAIPNVRWNQSLQHHIAFFCNNGLRKRFSTKKTTTITQNEKESAFTALAWAASCVRWISSVELSARSSDIRLLDLIASAMSVHTWARDSSSSDLVAAASLCIASSSFCFNATSLFAVDNFF